MRAPLSTPSPKKLCIREEIVSNNDSDNYIIYGEYVKGVSDQLSLEQNNLPGVNCESDNGVVEKDSFAGDSIDEVFPNINSAKC